MSSLVLTFVALIFVCAVGYAYPLLQRNVHQWVFCYLRRAWQMRGEPTRNSHGLAHVMFLFTDHFEPLAAGASDEIGRQRVQRWVDEYPKLAAKYLDADGCHPKHSFFYPEEEYRPEFLDMLGAVCRAGFGEVEVHLHHDNDTAAGLSDKLNRFTTTLHDRHGMLPALDGKPCFAFIHGNWALDNSRSDGRWCGVNNEIKVLADCGCYADFTLPCAPIDAQTSTVNAIYYATDNPHRPKSHDKGVEVEAGRAASGDLMIFQGPLALNWQHRRLGLWPRIENSDIEPHDVPVGERVRLWLQQWIHVKGRPEWVFIKVHTHGAIEGNANWIFGGECERLFTALQHMCNEESQFALHYVTAREAYNIVKAAEAGHTGNPGQYRDFLLPRPRGH